MGANARYRDLNSDRQVCLSTSLPFLQAGLSQVYIADPMSVLSIAPDAKLLAEIKAGYLKDPFIMTLKAAMPGTNIPHIREALFYLAHDALGHFGGDKSYASLRHSYYWPNMRKHQSTIWPTTSITNP